MILLQENADSGLLGSTDGPLPEIYRDEYLIAVHKPSGLLVHRTGIDRHETRFALQIVRHQCGRRVYPVHRLDKGTSGVLLFAFSPEVAAQLGSKFEDGRVTKSYLAVVRGHPPESGEVDHPLSRLHDKYADAVGDATPQEARTLFRCLASCELPHRVDRYPTSRYALLELNPLTGRRHQLRRHMKHIAHPIIGDTSYGKARHNRLFQTLFGNSRLLLACVEMTLIHPVRGSLLKLVAPLDERYTDVVTALGWREAVLPSWLKPFPEGVESANIA